MNLKLPQTKEEYLLMLEMAFREGQKSMEGDMKCESFGDHERYCETKAKYEFKEWANQKWNME